MTEATAAPTGDNGGAAGGATQGAGAAASEQQVWYSGLDEQTQAYVQNKGWNSPTDLLNSYRNLEKFAGGSKNLIELPGVDQGDEAWNAVYDRLGRPASPDEYGIEAPEWADPNMTDWFKQTAHELGLTDRQAKTLYEAYNGMVQEQMDAMEMQARESAEKEIEGLEREWGKAFNAQIDMGKRAVAALGFNEEQLASYESKLGTAEMLKLFATLGSKMGEDTFEGGERTGGSFGVTPAQAQQQIAELKMDKQFMDNYLSGNPEAVSKMQRLMEQAYG